MQRLLDVTTILDAARAKPALKDYHLALLEDIALHGPGDHWNGCTSADDLVGMGLLVVRDNLHHITHEGLEALYGRLGAHEVSP